MDWECSPSSDQSAVKIQGAFRRHQARLKLKEKAAWEVNEKMEYSSEQAEAKLREMFEALLDASPSFSPEIAEALQRLRSPDDEEAVSRSTNSENILIESDYQGPHINGPITPQIFDNLLDAFQRGQILHERYVNQILDQARGVLRTLPNFNNVDLSNLGHVTVVGDLHGQLADLLCIFDKNGLPSADNAYVFNGDFVDRGENSIEVILLLLVALILYPTAVFLNRGNHEDQAVNKKYGFLKEIRAKYQTCDESLTNSFSRVFKWLPLYSIIETGIHRIIVMHGGISNRIHLSKLQTLPRNQYWSVQFPPKSRTGSDNLTAEEVDEYNQIQDLLWSDPDPEGNASGCRENTDRNTACFFGADETRRFLQKYDLSMIVRSHQVKPEGYQYRHERKVLTIFSASNYQAGNNAGAVVRWEQNKPDHQIFQHNVTPADMQNLSLSQRVGKMEGSNDRQLIEKIVANRRSLLEAFQQEDGRGDGHISLRAWESIMTDVLQIALPWLTIRSKLVREDSEGVLYETMFEGYHLNNSRVPMPNSEMMEDLYKWKDILLSIFKMIDTNHSRSINRQELKEIIRFLMQKLNISNSDLDDYADELTNIMDSDGDGRINFEEFFEAFQLVKTE